MTLVKIFQIRTRLCRVGSIKTEMCILFVYRNTRPSEQSYKLIIISNRDETLKRPALPASYWDEERAGCLGGQDMEPGREGGTWFGLSTKGKAGIILNLTNENSKSKKNRGRLIVDYINSQTNAESYLNDLHVENQNGQPYNPYQLVLIELLNSKVYCLSSSQTSPGPVVCDEEILGFGNSERECPYEKVRVGKQRFNEIIENAQVSEEETILDQLIELLKSEEKYLPDPELERRCPQSFDILSSIFIRAEEYGTRTHSVLMLAGNNRMRFVEETRLVDGTWKRQSFVDLLPK